MIYIAGSLFTRSERKERLFEGLLIRSLLKSKGLTEQQAKDLVFNPIEQEHNDKSKLPHAMEIYNNDFKAITKAKKFLFNFDNPLDAGVFMEFGQVIQRIEQGEDLKVSIVMSDMRISTAGEYDKHHVPYGFNQYVIGAVDKFSIPVYSDVYGAIEYLI